MTKQNLKIALIGDCLAGGGAEKVMALLSVFFTKQGFEVHNCIFTDWISYDFGGKMINLGKIKSKNLVVKKIKKLLAFKKFIKLNDFDFCIDFRMRDQILKEILFAKCIYKTPTIYTVHSGILEFYFPTNLFFSKIIYKDKNIVSVSEAIAKRIVASGLNCTVQTIYNPIVVEKKDVFLYEKLDYQYIISVGRMNTNVKQFDQLIVAYTKTNLPKRNIKLLLVGDGILKSEYKHLAKNLGFDTDILFFDFQKNLEPLYENAIFTVLCSKNEGLPNVLLESLGCRTPVIAFDCFSGPSEIISDGENGILVENQNFEALEKAMNIMSENQELYLNCKQNALKSVQKFALKNIGQQWLDYLSALQYNNK